MLISATNRARYMACWKTWLRSPPVLRARRREALFSREYPVMPRRLHSSCNSFFVQVSSTGPILPEHRAHHIQREDRHTREGVLWPRSSASVRDIRWCTACTKKNAGPRAATEPTPPFYSLGSPRLSANPPFFFTAAKFHSPVRVVLAVRVYLVNHVQSSREVCWRTFKSPAEVERQLGP